MYTTLHKAEARGRGEHGWLSTRYSFSFADWYEPTRMGFGALRVLNDDTLAPNSGFPMHSHRDMEIITVVTTGTLTHEDSMGNKGTVHAGDVQVMSAGTGVVHSEYNASHTEPLALFQIWIVTDAKGHAPRYDQQSFSSVRNELQILVAPQGPLSVHQDARIYRGEYDAGEKITHELRGGRGAYLFVIEGSLAVGEETLGPRDALGISEAGEFVSDMREKSSFLLIDVPSAE